MNDQDIEDLKEAIEGLAASDLVRKAEVAALRHVVQRLSDLAEVRPQGLDSTKEWIDHQTKEYAMDMLTRLEDKTGPEFAARILKMLEDSSSI